jgi:hypothetical protein
MARMRLEDALAEVTRERAQGLAEVATQKAELRREIEAMQTHAEQQQGRVELNIGGHCFQTSVQTLRRLPHTFFDAYFSGRYAQDVCNNGSIFVDRDGEHFGHVLEYMRDGVVSVAEAGAHPSVSLLRALKREFGYYCIELMAEQSAEPAQLETAYVMGGIDDDGIMWPSMERYDTTSRRWSSVSNMSITRQGFCACVLNGEVYINGGFDIEFNDIRSVEKYSPSSDTWSAVVPMPMVRSHHCAVAVGSAMYVLGGSAEEIHKFDSLQGTWIVVAHDPRGICLLFAAVAVGTDIYVFGGEDDDHITQDTVMKYDTVIDAWSTLAPMPHHSSRHSASVCNGLVYIVGAGDNGEIFLCFDPATAEWSMLTPTRGATEVIAPPTCCVGACT